jgi:hypothetical protein
MSPRGLSFEKGPRFDEAAHKLASFLFVDHPPLDRFAVETPVCSDPKCGQLAFPEQAIDRGLVHAQVPRQLAHREHARSHIGFGLGLYHVILTFSALLNVVSTNRLKSQPSNSNCLSTQPKLRGRSNRRHSSAPAVHSVAVDQPGLPYRDLRCGGVGGVASKVSPDPPRRCGRRLGR